jgi:hypothetical protein
MWHNTHIKCIYSVQFYGANAKIIGQSKTVSESLNAVLWQAIKVIYILMRWHFLPSSLRSLVSVDLRGNDSDRSLSS